MPAGGTDWLLFSEGSLALAPCAEEASIADLAETIVLLGRLAWEGSHAELEVRNLPDSVEADVEDDIVTYTVYVHQQGYGRDLDCKILDYKRLLSPCNYPSFQLQ